MQMFRKGIFIVMLGVSFSASVLASNNSPSQLSEKFTAAQQLASSGKIDQAIVAYKTIIRLYPRLPEAYNNLAALYLSQNNSREAKNILEQGLHAHKGYAALYENLTAINVAMAKEAYSKALQIDVKATDIKIAALPLSANKAVPLNNKVTLTNKENNKVQTPSQPVEIAKVTKDTVNTNSQQAEIEINPIEEIAKTDDAQSIRKVLDAWSAAWSAQAVDIYLSFYHQQYQPSNGLSRKGWIQSRRYRLKKPDWIKVNLSDLRVKKNSANQATVRFKQSYSSNTFSDQGEKQLVMIYTKDGWKIFRELSL